MKILLGLTAVAILAGALIGQSCGSDDPVDELEYFITEPEGGWEIQIDDRPQACIELVICGPEVAN